MDDHFKCFLCERKLHDDLMQDIVVNGNNKQKACQTHDIDPGVNAYDFSDKPNSKTKAMIHGS